MVKFLGCDGRRSICRDELHDWPTPRLAHRSARCRSQPAPMIQSQPRIGDVVFASRSGEFDRRLSQDVAADRQAR